MHHAAGSLRRGFGDRLTRHFHWHSSGLLLIIEQNRTTYFPRHIWRLGHDIIPLHVRPYKHTPFTFIGHRNSLACGVSLDSFSARRTSLTIHALISFSLSSLISVVAALWGLYVYLSTQRPSPLSIQYNLICCPCFVLTFILLLLLLLLLHLPVSWAAQLSCSQTTIPRTLKLIHMTPRMGQNHLLIPLPWHLIQQDLRL